MDSEVKKQIVEEYLASNPNESNTLKITSLLADKYEVSPNIVRQQLTSEGVYVYKKPHKAPTVSSGTAPKKADAINGFKTLLTNNNLLSNTEFVGKMTGKSVLYFKDIIEAALNHKSKQLEAAEAKTKAEKLSRLKSAIISTGKSVDNTIVDKLTGKTADALHEAIDTALTVPVESDLLKKVEDYENDATRD